MEKLIEAFSDLARRAEKSGCKLAIYNYGSWFGEVDVQLGVIEGIRKETGIDVGTVLNFHRGHHLMDEFPEALERMMPHLVAVNINGMEQEGCRLHRWRCQNPSCRPGRLRADNAAAAL